MGIRFVRREQFGGMPFELIDLGERVLVVVTGGEEDERGKYHASVSRVFLKRNAVRLRDRLHKLPANSPLK